MDKRLTLDEKYMLVALKEAKKAYQKDEVPIGAIIVLNGKIISRAHNLRESKNLATGHAEILAIEKANKKLDSWRLVDATMYVTLEPCLMCSGAIIQSRIKRVVYGAFDLKMGAIDSTIKINDIKTMNHHIEITQGILKEECSLLISSYFKNKRMEKAK
ncbi:MAG: tRNA adenosine(34) deaminase TadA [Bacilli bacterium]